MFLAYSGILSLPQIYTNREDKSQVKNVIYHAATGAVAALEANPVSANSGGPRDAVTPAHWK